MAIPVDVIRFEWTLPINKILADTYRPELFHESDDFKFNDAKFYLKVKPREAYVEGLNSDDEASWDVYFYLCVRDFGPHESLKVRRRLWLTDDNGRTISVANERDQDFVKAGYNWKANVFSVYEREFERTDVRPKSSEVTIHCELYYKEDDLNQQLNVWRQKIEQLADIDEAAGFCSFRVDGQDFKVATHLLVIHSEVFERMFTTDTKELQTGVVEIKDVKAEVIQALIGYLNTGKIGNTESYLEELFLITDKYAFKELQGKCTDLLLETLDESNCLRRLQVAFTCVVSEFRESMVKHISNPSNKVNLLELAKTEEWKKFAVTNHQVSNEIMDAFFKQVKWIT